MYKRQYCERKKLIVSVIVSRIMENERKKDAFYI